jgi:hypothetical protein
VLSLLPNLSKVKCSLISSLAQIKRQELGKEERIERTWDFPLHFEFGEGGCHPLGKAR